MRLEGLDQNDLSKYLGAMNELFQDEKPTVRHLREIEFLLSSAYRGYGYLISRQRDKSYVSETSDGKKFEISEKYVQELGGLFLPFFGVDAHLGRTMVGSPVARIPKRSYVAAAAAERAANYEHVLVDEQESDEAFREGSSSVKEMFKVGPHLSTCSVQVPLSILLLFMNLGVMESNCRCVPIYLNQPNVNNRRVRVSDVFDENLCGKPNRGPQEFGTLETAWGDAPLTMDALKAVVFFYEVHSKGHHSGPQVGELRPCLDSIPSGEPLVGRPFASKVSLGAATSLFFLFIKQEPSEVFPEEYSVEGVKEDHLAHRIVCTVLHFMRVRFNSLRASSDWIELHNYLRSEISEKMKRLGEDGKCDVNEPWVQIFTKLPATPKSDVNVRKSVWMMMNAFTPIRVAFLDGQRRATGAMYAMLHRKPEDSLSQLEKSLDPTSSDLDLLVTNRKPDFDILSAWVSIDSVRPNVSTKPSPGGEIENITLSLLKKHSELIQQESSCARVRKFTDALVGILSSIEKEPELREKLTIPGELQMRFNSVDKKKMLNPNNWPATDTEKNDQVYVALWDYVIGQLFSDTSVSVQDQVKAAVNKMSEMENTTENMKRATFVSVNRQTYESETKTKGGLSTAKTVPRNRQELNSVAMLFGNYISGLDCLNKLVNIAVMQQGKIIPSLCRDLNPLSNKDGKVPGMKADNGILFGVS